MQQPQEYKPDSREQQQSNIDSIPEWFGIMVSWKIVVALLFFLDLGNSANILFFHHAGSYSHRVATYPLADELAKRGHQVTFLSGFPHRGPYKNSNITEIVPKKFAAALDDWLATDFDVNFRINKTLPNNVDEYFPINVEACQILLESEEFREYLEKTSAIDLMIMDNCHSECGMALKHKYHSKHVIMTTVTYLPSEHDIHGMAPESAAIPELEMFSYGAPMTFWEKVVNTLISIHYRYVYYTWYIPKIDALIRKNVKECQDMPYVDDLYRDSSMIFYTGDIVTDYPRALPPNVVRIPALHCPQEETKELPKEIKQFLGDGSSSDEGFVYISLGSIVVASKLPEEMKQMFFQTMERLPKVKFLWRWSGEIPKKIPKNLYLNKWFPQNDILGHPKLKAFITQAGRPSTVEALCKAVPMISFPVLGDQDVIANRMNEIGGNIRLEFGTLTQQELQLAVEKAVYDSLMKQRMLKLQTILHDNPLTSLDTAVWWTEYVLRHNNTDHLKPAGFHQWWYERRLLDVWAFIFTALLIVGATAVVITVLILKLLSIMLIVRDPTKKKKGD